MSIDNMMMIESSSSFDVAENDVNHRDEEKRYHRMIPDEEEEELDYGYLYDERYEEDENDEEQEEEERRHAVAEIASTISYIQKMNNLSAMSMIGVGKYDKAIEKLGNALKILNSIDDITMDYYHSSKSTNRECSLDGCIEHSEQKTTNLGMKELLCMTSMSAINQKTKKKNKKNGEEDDVAFAFHKTPICIPKRSIREGHVMGSSLFLIITFNLTLAHHFKVLKKYKSSKKSSSSTTLISGTVQLYEVLLNAIDDDSSISYDESNKRFINIVENNLKILKDEFVATNEKEKNKNDDDDAMRGGRSSSSRKKARTNLVDRLSFSSIDKKIKKKHADKTKASLSSKKQKKKTKTKTKKVAAATEPEPKTETATSPPVEQRKEGLTLYEQHKELLRQRYHDESTSSEFSSSLDFTAADVKEKSEELLSSRLQNAMRNSSTFTHLQNQNNVQVSASAYR